MQNQIEKHENNIKEILNEKVKMKEENERLFQEFNHLKLINQANVMELKNSEEILKSKIQENNDLKQDLELLNSKISMNLNSNEALISKNTELTIQLEVFQEKFKIKSEEWEEKQKNQINEYTNNLSNIKTVLNVTKEIIKTLKGDKEKAHLDYKALNENYQTLHCKYAISTKNQKELSYKLDIMNVNLTCFIN